MDKVVNKINGESLDISADNREKLKQLFPSVFTETVNDKGELVESVDFEKLKAEIGNFTDLFENRRERYGMDWPGKKEALRLIQTPSMATLKPCPEESVNFDTTENLFIEGDNLEVLKLLQKSYYGKVKMIYIDPPYNTGNEFIYPDNYSESLETYLEYAGLIDGEGKKFSTNTVNEGRFHTKWLNMMYPRLYLAKNLLSEHGVIFFNIGEEEISNSEKLLNEIFGEENKISIIARVAKTASNLGSYFAPSIDFILCYCKNLNQLPTFKDKVDESLYKKIEVQGLRKGEYYRDDVALYQASQKDLRPNQKYFIVCPDGSKVIPPCSVLDEVMREGDGRWRWSKERYLKNKDFIVFKETNNSPLLNQDGKQAKYNLYTKSYLKDREEDGTLPRNILNDFINRKGADLIKKYDIEFDFSKPIELMYYLAEIIGTKDGDLILDFFAGSCSTAHSILDLNNQDEGSRNFIMVQLPEPCLENSEAFKAGYKTIADIGKERLRRVIKKLNEENENKLNFGKKSQDRGFKVLKLDKSNFKQWQKLTPETKPEQIEKQLEMHIDHVDHQASQEDLLYEILIKAGFKPTENVKTVTFSGIPVFSIADGGLLICLAKAVTKDFINAIAEAEPMQFICLDSAFGGNDQLKANAAQTFAARNMGREKANQIIFRTV